MANIVKVDVPTVTPTVLRHHRELEASEYNVILSGFGESMYLIKRHKDGALLLIDWQGESGLLDEFEVLEDGGLRYPDPNDRLQP